MMIRLGNTGVMRRSGDASLSNFCASLVIRLKFKHDYSRKKKFICSAFSIYLLDEKHEKVRKTMDELDGFQS
jgi:hypothetical protein